MFKYSVGDRVVIGELNRVSHFGVASRMKKWIGKTMTIRECYHHPLGGLFYRMIEDMDDTTYHRGKGWCWAEEWIAGFAEDESEVEIKPDELMEVLISG